MRVVAVQIIGPGDPLPPFRQRRARTGAAHPISSRASHPAGSSILISGRILGASWAATGSSFTLLGALARRAPSRARPAVAATASAGRSVGASLLRHGRELGRLRQPGRGAEQRHHRLGSLDLGTPFSVNSSAARISFDRSVRQSLDPRSGVGPQPGLHRREHAESAGPLRRAQHRRQLAECRAAAAAVPSAKCR